MKIAILGLGHVGLTSAVCLVSEGHEVTGIDPDEEKLAELLAGRCPISEPGLDELLRKSFASGQFQVSREIDTALLGCDGVIVCVGTPNAIDGSHDLSQVIAASGQIAVRLRERETLEPIIVVPQHDVAGLNPMWTPEHRRAAARDGLRYASDLEDLRTGIPDSRSWPPITGWVWPCAGGRWLGQSQRTDSTASDAGESVEQLV